MKTRRSNRLAFTLVEVMIAMAILTVVVTAIYATWRCILSATQATQKAAAQVQRSRVAMRTMEQSLTYMTMYVANMNYYWFDAHNGSDATLSFVSVLPRDFPRSGRFDNFPVRRVEFAIENGREGGRDLVLRQRLIMREFDEDERNYPLVLMHDVKKFEMEFWDMRRNDWTDEWTETNQMPKLIRFSLTTGDPSRPFDRGEEYVRIISPASVAVQPAWQGGGGGGAARPPGATGGGIIAPPAGGKP